MPTVVSSSTKNVPTLLRMRARDSTSVCYPMSEPSLLAQMKMIEEPNTMPQIKTLFLGLRLRTEPL